MEICTLALRVTEEELNGWVRPVLEGTGYLSAVSVSVDGKGLVLRGEGNMLGVSLPFEADLEAAADGAFVAVRLAAVRSAGVPMKPLLMPWITGRLKQLEREWLQVEEDTVVVNVERLLARQEVRLTANLTGIRCEPGALLLEAQAPSPVGESA
jgi:hypothetical protein